jgi:type IV secretory pathway VirD2 relaxase
MADRARLLRSRVAAGNDVDGRAFAERSEGDRHHFRFIVSPDDAGQLGSLRNFTRELMIRPRAT